MASATFSFKHIAAQPGVDRRGRGRGRRWGAGEVHPLRGHAIDVFAR